jgi:hypothetical protein
LQAPADDQSHHIRRSIRGRTNRWQLARRRLDELQVARPSSQPTRDVGVDVFGKLCVGKRGSDRTQHRNRRNVIQIVGVVRSWRWRPTA